LKFTFLIPFPSCLTFKLQITQVGGNQRIHKTENLGSTAFANMRHFTTFFYSATHSQCGNRIKEYFTVTNPAKQFFRSSCRPSDVDSKIFFFTFIFGMSLSTNYTLCLRNQALGDDLSNVPLSGSHVVGGGGG
jgi:hypothetical protein